MKLVLAGDPQGSKALVPFGLAERVLALFDSDKHAFAVLLGVFSTNEETARVSCAVLCSRKGIKDTVVSMENPKIEGSLQHVGYLTFRSSKKAFIPMENRLVSTKMGAKSRIVIDIVLEEKTAVLSAFHPTCEVAGEGKNTHTIVKGDHSKLVCVYLKHLPNPKFKVTSMEKADTEVVGLLEKAAIDVSPCGHTYLQQQEKDTMEANDAVGKHAIIADNENQVTLAMPQEMEKAGERMHHPEEPPCIVQEENPHYPSTTEGEDDQQCQTFTEEVVSEASVPYDEFDTIKAVYPTQMGELEESAEVQVAFGGTEPPMEQKVALDAPSDASKKYKRYRGLKPAATAKAAVRSVSKGAKLLGHRLGRLGRGMRSPWKVLSCLRPRVCSDVGPVTI